MGVTFLTGASSGIGRSLARRLAAGGEVVAAAARRKPLLDSLVVEIEKQGGRALAVRGRRPARSPDSTAGPSIRCTIDPATGSE